MIKVAVIGCGYWGPKLARNFADLPGSSLEWVCDFRQDRLLHLQRLYPGVRTTDSVDFVLESDVDAVAIATPVFTHHDLAIRALNAGKHVLVEKPLAASSVEAARIVEVAERLDRVVMAGHTFLYNPAVLAVRDIIASGELGDILYVNGVRVNLGLFQPDINVLWDLAPHDVSILLFILGAAPDMVSARGSVCVQRDRGIHDIAHLTARFPRGVLADIRLSWLDPVKVRKYTVVGSKKMLVYDDLAGDDKVVIFDKRVEIPPHSDTEQQFRASYHQGDDGVAYPVDWSEPLRNECADFISSVRHGRAPRSDGGLALKVVQILEAADRSLQRDGRWEDLEELWMPLATSSASRLM